jgi:tyrosine-protein phosphatase SIW14
MQADARYGRGSKIIEVTPMKISGDKLSRVLLPFFALTLVCGSARGFQAATSDATQPSANSSAANSAAGDAKPAPANEQHAIAKMIPVHGIPKFGEVSPLLYRGAQPTSDGLELLAKMGVAIIVNLRPGDHPEEEDEASRLGMRYVSIPWRCYHPNDAAIADFLHVLRENPDKKIFVHCELGTDRTGMSIAAYRMSMQGWSPDEAMKEMQAYGFSSSHHPTCRGLAEYEHTFPSAFKTHLEFLDLRPVDLQPATER